MKRNELGKYIKDYCQFFTSEWEYDLTRFVRKVGPWIEWVDFRAHYYWPSYLPVHGFIFFVGASN
jgi:hypothetical protein